MERKASAFRGSANHIGTDRTLQNLLQRLRAHRLDFEQVCTERRNVGMVLGEPFNFARHGVTQNLVASGMTGGDWSAWYRQFSYPRPDETQPIFTFCRLLLTERK
jgi:hypothetical protein